MSAGAKRRRQQAILRAIRARRLGTQEELVAELRHAGIDATQATLSRDIVELGLVKVRGPDGDHYALPARPETANGSERLRRFCEDYPVEGGISESLVVLRSSPGTASAMAAAIDACGLADVVGTLAGDDTVFVATPSRVAARGVLRRLREFGVGERTERDG